LLWHLEGKTLEAIARELDWPLGTVATRLTRARARLQARLARRGLGFSVGLAAIASSRNSAPAAVTGALAERTVRAALRLGAGQGGVSPAVAGLIEGVLTIMKMNRLKAAMVVFLVLGVLAVGAGGLALRLLAGEPGGGVQENKANAAPGPAGQRKVTVKVPSQREGVLQLIGTEIKKGEKVPEDRLVTVMVDDRLTKYRRLKEGDRVEEGQLLARLDDRLARNDWAIQKQKILIREAELRAAQALREVYKGEVARLAQIRKLNARAVSVAEFELATAQFKKYTEEALAKKEAVKLAELEALGARLILEMHEIRSPASGVIRTLYRRPGEAIKALGPVALIEVAPAKK
jgi:multidrug efflux pump subunit AcrA (membrane-fusion protein)